MRHHLKMTCLLQWMWALTRHPRKGPTKLWYTMCPSTKVYLPTVCYHLLAVIWRMRPSRRTSQTVSMTMNWSAYAENANAFWTCWPRTWCHRNTRWRWQRLSWTIWLVRLIHCCARLAEMTSGTGKQRACWSSPHQSSSSATSVASICRSTERLWRCPAKQSKAESPHWKRSKKAEGSQENDGETLRVCGGKLN